MSVTTGEPDRTARPTTWEREPHDPTTWEREPLDATERDVATITITITTITRRRSRDDDRGDRVVAFNQSINQSINQWVSRSV